jgi:hypothetical protein
MSFAVFSFALGFASLRRATWFSVALYLCAIIALACAIVLAMGQPRPRWTFVQAPHDATLLAAHLQEPVAIYLWLLPDGVSTPVAVKLPWSESAAMQQQTAAQAAHQAHGQVRLRFVRGQPQFYISAIDALTAKAGEQ